MKTKLEGNVVVLVNLFTVKCFILFDGTRCLVFSQAQTLDGRMNNAQ